jgi:uncharacterized protein (TIGR04255 family)
MPSNRSLALPIPEKDSHAYGKVSGSRVKDVSSTETPIQRSFDTPLYEAVAEIHLLPGEPVEFRALSLYQALRDRFPHVQRVPMVLVAEPSQAINPFAPAYRFYNDSQNLVVQTGPRLIAVNAVMAKSPWPGWNAFNDAMQPAFDAYVALNGKSAVTRFSLSFYNRIAVSDIAEIQQVFGASVPAPHDALLSGFSYQYETDADIGVLARQYTVMPPDASAERAYLAVNTIARRDLDGLSLESAYGEWPAWLDAAHAQCRALFYSSLSEPARSAWDRNAATRKAAE